LTPQGPTWEYLHLIANPFALVLTATGGVVGLIGWAIGRESLERWGLLSLLLGGLFAIPAYLTGLTAADVASTRTFVRPSVVQTHRVWATWALVLLLAQAVLAAFALYQPDDARLRRFVLLVGLVGASLVGWVAYLGGKIVHGPEVDAERVREQAYRPSPEIPIFTDSEIPTLIDRETPT
jgi:uncharacterized membrane protein